MIISLVRNAGDRSRKEFTMSKENITRRHWLKTAGLAATTAPLFISSKTYAKDSVPLEIGSRRELFVDRQLIDRLAGAATLRLQHPIPREQVLTHDAPWEGTGSGYHSVFQDGDVYRMYYKGWHLDVSQGKLNGGRHPLYCCYAESKDGINWQKPELGLHPFQGSTKNNITIMSGKRGSLNIDAGHPAVFKDDNPDAPANARYKAIVRSSKPNGLIPLASPDGLRWRPISEKPILMGLGAFDSQNLAFWDPNIGKYRAYWRIFTAGVTESDNWKPAGIRAIRTAVSDDLVNWRPHKDLTYVDSPPEELYTNQVKPYHRAPHLLLGFPTRYIDRGWSEAMRALPDLAQRKLRASSVQRYGTALTEPLLMASRNGTHFHRWNEAFLRPGNQRPGTWHYGQQYLAWHIVETASSLPGADRELSLYGSESYRHGKGSALRRYTLRLDGFVAANAGWKGGELVTKPFTFTGNELELNFATSAAGSLKVEIQNPDGTPMAGYTLADASDLFGDTVAGKAHWKQGSKVTTLGGKPIRLRFVLKDADLYSFQFTS